MSTVCVFAQRLALSFFCAATFSACGAESTTPIDLNVGPEGGQFTFLDGQIVVTVPPNAVATPTRLTVQAASLAPATPLLVSGSALEFGPVGTVLALPLQVQVSYAGLAAALPAVVRESELRLGRVEGSAWTYPAGTALVDTVTDRLTASIASFGTYGLLGVPAANVVITSAPTQLATGETVALVAQARDAANTFLPARPINWSSLEPSVASVGATSGQVSALAVGSSRIVASAESRADTATIAVVSGSGVAPIMVEDFSTYTSFSQFLSDPRGIYQTESSNTNRMVLDTAVRFGTSDKSLRYDYPAGTSTDFTISRSFHLPAGSSEVWVEAVVRFSANFTLNGNGQGAGAALKLLHVGIPSGGPAGRFGINFEGGDNSVLRAEGPNDAYEALYFFTNVTSRTLFNEEWHTIRYRVRSGASDFHEVWINGVNQGSRTGNSAANGVIAVSLAKNLNMLAASPQQMWWGRVTIWTTNPGW